MKNAIAATRDSPCLQLEEVSKLRVLRRKVLGATFNLSMSEEELLYFALGTSQLIVLTILGRISCSYHRALARLAQLGYGPKQEVLRIAEE